MILVAVIVDGRYLALTECVVERVVDLGDRDPKTRCGFAVDRDVGLESSVLLVAVDVGEPRHLLQFGKNFRRPGVEFLDGVGLKGKLILRIRGAAAAPDVLDRLQEQRRARDLGKFAAQSPDHQVRRYLALAQRLERHEDEAAIGLPAAGEADHGIDGRILLDDRDELLQLLPHQLERNALVALDAAGDTARILLREEALWNDRVEIEIGRDGRQQDGQDQARVVERPGERVLVAAQHGVEEPLGHAMKAALPVGLRALEQQRTHHRGGRQRDRERHYDRHRERHGKFAKQAAHDAAH